MAFSTSRLVAEVVCLVIAAIAATTDWRKGIVPNWLTLPVLVAAPVAWGLYAGWTGLLVSVIGALVCGLVPAILFYGMKASGGGDVKLFAALGAVGGYFLGLEAQFLGFVLAAFFSMARLAWQGKLWRTLGRTVFLLVNPVLPKKWRRELKREEMEMVRMGVPVFAGTLIAVLWQHPTLWM